MMKFIISTMALAATANAGSWKKAYDAHIAVGAAAGDDTHGAVAGGTPSAACLYETSDYGKTFECDDSKTTLFLDVGMDSTGKNQVAGQILSAPTYSNDGGKTFTKGKVAGAIAYMGQSVEFAKFDDNTVAMAGQAIPSSNGMIVSGDAGKTWKSFDIGADSNHPARYVGVASPTTWYVTAGTWPTSQDDKPSTESRPIFDDVADDFGWDDFMDSNEDARLAKRIEAAARGEYDLSARMTFTPEGVKVSAPPARRLSLSGDGDGDGGDDDATPSPGYYAEVYKTTDAGATWTKVFGDDTAAGRFYPNGISCASETQCAFVAEGFGETGAESGAWIFTTNDGGETWTEALQMDAGSSMMAVRYLSETEAWAGGGVMRGKVEAHYYHTTDGGKTWDLESTYPHVSVIGMDMADATHGYAAAVTQFQQGIIMTYDDGSSSDDATDDGGDGGDDDSSADCHFEDPNETGGCRADEAGPIQIQGIAGTICAPECTDAPCPTDVCQGTAQPQCALSSPQGQKFCALVCSPDTQFKNLRAGDAQCGEKASCKPIQGTGICTYDS